MSVSHTSLAGVMVTAPSSRTEHNTIFSSAYTVGMGSGGENEETGSKQDDNTFKKVRKHVKEFVEASPEEHSK